MYYVYEWYDIDTNEIIYVGKGSGKRYKIKNKNSIFNDFISTHNCTSRIIKNFDLEEEAFKYEAERIKELAKQGQCCCNLQPGGYGGTVNGWTKELKQEFSEHNIMKTQRQKERMSKNNPMKNKKIAEKVNSQKRKPVIINDKEFISIKSAAQEIGVSTSTIREWCIQGKNPRGWKCYFKNNPNIQVYNNKAKNGTAKKVLYKNKIYKSAGELAKILGKNQTTISRWCRQLRDSEGNECRYIDDERQAFQDDTPRNLPFYINGKKYLSKTEASKELNITPYFITQLLEKRQTSKKYQCEYDNQQPSQN